MHRSLVYVDGLVAGYLVLSGLILVPEVERGGVYAWALSAHLVVAVGIAGLWWELFHLLYVSYYLLLIGSTLGVWGAAPDRLPRFAFVVTGMFVSFLAVFIAFPVAGPLPQPDVSQMTSGWFPQLVAWIYVPFRMDGIATGAFPSSHVGMSVGIACLLAPRRWTWRALLWGLVGALLCRPPTAAFTTPSTRGRG